MKFATASSFSRAWTLLSLTMARATTTLHPSSTAGAVYFGANLDNNFIITNSIASDGTVKFARAISTHGQGATGAKSAPGPDPLFSQDSLKVSGCYLYAVNAGSNSVSMFKINQDDPTDLQIIGDAIDSGGDFPVSIAVSSSRNMVCVLNGGANNGVNCYAPNPWAGLIPISGTRRSLNLTQTTPPSGPPNTVSDIIFSPDGTKLLAAVKGTPPSPGFLAAWDIRADRSLSSTFEASTPAMGGALPFSITAVKGVNAVLVTDPAIGFSIYDLTRLNVDNRVPATSTIVNVTGQKAICWSEYSPRTNRYYLSDAGASQIIEAEVNGHLQGSVVQRYSLTVNSTSLDTAIASLSHTDYLYVLSANSKAIDVFSLNQPGNAMHVQTYSFDTTLQNAGVTVDSSRLQGMAVYVKN